MKLELYFTEAEMCTFLISKGYTIEKIKSWRSWTEYHNQVESEDVDILIAHKVEPLKNVLKGSVNSILPYYGVEAVFRKEIHAALLKL